MNDLSPKPRVLHISADYPDANRAETTQAVRTFVRSNAELDYFVISLNRVTNPFKCNSIQGDDQGDPQVLSMRYWGFPYGLLLALSMLIVAFRAHRMLRRQHIKVDLIHAHKLTFEGLAAQPLARWLKVPLVVSVRGEAESKVLQFKPHYKSLIKRVLEDSARVLYVSAWFRPILNRHFDIPAEKQALLPNFVSENSVSSSNAFERDHFVTILDLNVFRKKGLDRLLLAFTQCLKQCPNAKLDIIGRGSEQVIAEVLVLIVGLGLQDRVKLLGTFDNAELLQRLPHYAALVLPSHNETFGMVYVEALLSGIPILYSKSTGIDGFVDWIPAKVGVDPASIKSITEGLNNLLEHQEAYRQWLIENQQAIQANFDRDTYLSQYNKTIRELLGCVI
ncbi:MAG: glycosyltransferase family 4 protein [Methylobacter sp.]|nr:glycosyltransferase family 4 protein [Methylobacter sp.]